MHHHVFRPLPAFCMVIAFLLIGAAALNSLQPVSPASSVEMNVFAAGDRETVSPGEGFSSELKGIDPENITSIELAGIGMIDDPRQCAVLVSLLNDEAVRVEKTVADDIYSLTFRTADNKICFNAEDPFLFGEENWSCPVFFSYFRKMMNE